MRCRPWRGTRLKVGTHSLVASSCGSVVELYDALPSYVWQALECKDVPPAVKSWKRTRSRSLKSLEPLVASLAGWSDVGGAAWQGQRVALAVQSCQLGARVMPHRQAMPGMAQRYNRMYAAMRTSSRVPSDHDRHDFHSLLATVVMLAWQVEGLLGPLGQC